MRYFTSYFANFRNIPKNFLCVGISRYYQDYFKRTDIENYLYVPNSILAPSEKLLKAMKLNLITEREYTGYYEQELAEGVGRLGYPSEKMYFEDLDRNLSADGKFDAVVFLCYEKPKEFCHRHILSRHMRESGFDCRELTADDIRSKNSKGTPVQTELF